MPCSHRTDCKTSFERPFFAALLLATVASIACAQPAASQQRPDVAPTGSEIAPRGQRDVKDVTYGDWKKLCFKPGGAKMLCRTSITGRTSSAPQPSTKAALPTCSLRQWRVRARSSPATRRTVPASRAGPGRGGIQTIFISRSMQTRLPLLKRAKIFARRGQRRRVRALRTPKRR